MIERERERERVEKMSEPHVMRMKKSLWKEERYGLWKECVSRSRELNGGKNTMKIMNERKSFWKKKNKL
jgi:hypothetical protein